MKERPIPFSGPMVRAILEGRKTQTRRVIKLPSAPNHLGQWEPTSSEGLPAVWHTRTGVNIACPYGLPGDRLWVRETYLLKSSGTIYRADFDPVEAAGISGLYCGWKSSRFMPRMESRIKLEITGVRVERLQDISEKDCYGEGIDRPVAKFMEQRDCEREAARLAFHALWDSLNGKTYPWASNPWVWVIEFKKLA